MRHTINGKQFGSLGMKLQRSFSFLGTPSQPQDWVEDDGTRKRLAQNLALNVHALCKEGCTNPHLPYTGTKTIEIEIETEIEKPTQPNRKTSIPRMPKFQPAEIPDA